MAELVSSPILDAILFGVLAELIILVLLLRSRDASFLIRPLCYFLISGGFLLAATRAALSTTHSGLIGPLLLGGFFCHVLLLNWMARHYQLLKRGDTAPSK